MKAAFLFLALTAAAQPQAPAGPGQAFIALVRQPFSSLDPAVSEDVASYSLIANIYEPLIAFDGAHDRFKPWLAEAVPTRENGSISADGRVYRFTIRKGVRFHNGGEMTPEDARHSLLRELLIEETSGSSSLFLRPIFGVDSALDGEGRWILDPARVERAVRIEGRDLVLELEQPFPGLLALVASWPVVLPKAWATAKGDWDGVAPKPGEAGPKASLGLRMSANGTGPYRLDRADDDGSQAWLSRFEGYWGAAPSLAEVYVRAEPSDAMRVAMLRDGQADYAYLERSDLPLVAADSDIHVSDGLPNYSTGETFFFTLAVDPKDNPRLGSGKLDGGGMPADFFKNEAVRQAFAKAFDADAYLAEALRGHGTRAGGPIPATLAEGPSANPHPYDPKKAQALLVKALGKNGLRTTITYTRGSARRQIAAELLQKSIQAMDPAYKIELEALDTATFTREHAAHRLPIFIHALAPDYPDAHAVASQFFHSKGYFAKAQALADPELDRLEEAATHEADPKARDAQFRKLEALAAGRAYQIYTAQPAQFKAHCAWLSGIDSDHSMSALGFANLLYWPALTKDRAGHEQHRQKHETRP